MKLLSALYFCLLIPVFATAQEESAEVYYAKRYLEINIKKQVRGNNRIAKEQGKILDKLENKEKRYARRLQKHDSAAYKIYQSNPITFDSIGRIKKPDSNPLSVKAKNRTNSAIDTLNGVNKFLEDRVHATSEGERLSDSYENRISSLKNDASHNSDVNKLICTRTNFLKSIKTKDGNHVTGLKSMQKQAFYSSEKIRVFKQISDEPSIAEEKALEYLQGKEGFDKYLSEGASGGKSMSGKSVQELEKIGYQTKQKVQQNLQKKLGNDLSGLQNNLGGQIKNYQDKLQQVEDAKNTAQQTKSSIKGLRNIEQTAFVVNPMRGLPFCKRIEHQYNWQTSRAGHNGKPAIFSFSYMAGFKQTPRLSYGLGLATSLGLGSNWNNVRFSFQGLGLRSYAAWQLQYGIGAYAGYERMYKQAVFITKDEITLMANETPHNKKVYSEAVLIGLTKAYKINDKMNGSIQLLYDIWWKEKGLRSPVQLRFATMKN